MGTPNQLGLYGQQVQSRFSQAKGLLVKMQRRDVCEGQIRKGSAEGQCHGSGGPMGCGTRPCSADGSPGSWEQSCSGGPAGKQGRGAGSLPEEAAWSSLPAPSAPCRVTAREPAWSPPGWGSPSFMPGSRGPPPSGQGRGVPLAQVRGPPPSCPGRRVPPSLSSRVPLAQARGAGCPPLSGLSSPLPPRRLRPAQ